jgi:hypothetical protein
MFYRNEPGFAFVFQTHCYGVIYWICLCDCDQIPLICFSYLVIGVGSVPCCGTWEEDNPKAIIYFVYFDIAAPETGYQGTACPASAREKKYFARNRTEDECTYIVCMEQ